jgi:uncharacterized cupin superfamily protein
MPPGARNFPLHSHATEWEFYLVVSGAGQMRAGRKTANLKVGDCVLNPPGKKDLLYYVFANNAPVDIWYSPDSKQWGWTIERGGYAFRKSSVDYYDGEE